MARHYQYAAMSGRYSDRIYKNILIPFTVNRRKNIGRIHENYERWLASNKLGESERAELEALRGNEDEIKERFSSLLSFGTAGLRGTMAMGMHNMNIYTVTQATQGFAAYIRACGEDAVKRGVVVGCDSRHNSRRFSRATAAVMANNGIKVYLFASIQPTRSCPLRCADSARQRV